MRHLISKASLKKFILELVEADKELKEIKKQLMLGKKAKNIEISESFLNVLEKDFAINIHEDLKASMKILVIKKHITLDEKTLKEAKDMKAIQ